MSFEYQGFATLGVNLNRQKYGPLDISNVFISEQDLNYYLSKGAIVDGVSDYWLEIVPYPYAGQIVALVNADRSVQVFVLGEKEDGTFETLEVGANVDLSQYSTTEEMNQAIEDAVNAIDLSSFITESDVNDKIEQAIAEIEIPENIDTKTTITSGDNYINVSGELVDGADNAFVVSINLDTLKALIGSETTAAMEFKGAISELPENANKGDVYKASIIFAVPSELDAEGKGFATNVGDSLVADGDGKWYLIPSGDDVEDTWRPVEGVGNNATLIFNAGDLLEVVVNEDGNITYSHAKVAAPVKNADESGEREYVTGFETDEYGHIISYTTAKESVVNINDTYTAGDGIIIESTEDEHIHNIQLKIKENEKNLVLDENGLATNFDLSTYATKDDVATEKGRAEAAELALSQRIDNKVEKIFYPVVNEDGSTSQVPGALLTPEEKEKLEALSINPDGSVGVSGTINASNVQGLGSWLTDNGAVYIQNLTENNLSDAVNEKLNFITDVDDLNFKVEDGQLQLVSITAAKISDLQDLLDKKVDAEEGSRLISHTEITLLESLANGTFDNVIQAVNPDVFEITADSTLNLVAVPKAALSAALGDFATLPNADKDFTLVDEINNIYQMLTWSDLT